MAGSIDPRANFDPRFQTEEIAFSRNELVACRCGRSNPPNRSTCLYCGSELETATRVSPELDLSKPEFWENVFNLIVREARDDIDFTAISRLLGLDAAFVRSVLGGNLPLPIMRVKSDQTASKLKADLEQLGCDCDVVPDEELLSDRPPIRISALGFYGDYIDFKDFNLEKQYQFSADALVLAVSGWLFVSRLDSVEKRRLGGKMTDRDDSMMVSDEKIVDIYAGNDPGGFRIMSGFDFSCLGDHKGLFAGENLARLLDYLRQLSPNLRRVDNYLVNRELLGQVWELDTESHGRGIQRVGFGKRALATGSTTSNLTQFTKYSRMHRRLLA